MALTVQQAAIDLLAKLGVETTDPTTADALMQQDVMAAINTAGQYLQRAGEDFFTRTSIMVGITAGTAQYTLAEPIQAVIGPIRWNGTVPLDSLRSRGQLDQFDRLFLGDADYGAGPGVPIAYWVESVYANQGFQGDIASINIYLCPTPNISGSLTIECIQEFPAFTVSQIGSTAQLPAAQGYTDTIFMPLARYYIMTSSFFSRYDLKDQITVDYQRAIDELSTAGGFPDATVVHGDRQRVGERQVNA